MDVLHKIVTFCLNPLTVGLLVLLVAFVVGHGEHGGKSTRSARLILFLAIVWCWVWSTPMMTRWIGLPLEREYPSVAVESYPEADVICLLGGGMEAWEEVVGGQSSVVGSNDRQLATNKFSEMELSADRVWMAAKLWKSGKAKVITITGGGAWDSTVPLLEDLGVPTNAVVFIEGAKNTEDEARLIAGTPGLRRDGGVLLVTSAWHMRRAKWLFERAGLAVTPAPCDHECMMRFTGEPFELRELLPDAESLFRNSFLWKEHFAYWCYRVREVL